VVHDKISDTTVERRQQVETAMKKTAKPIVAGILAIAAVGLKLLVFTGAIIASLVIPVSSVPQFGIGEIAILLLIVIFLVLGILAIVGGIHALQRKKYGLAFTGSITSFLPFSFLGLACVILMALSKHEIHFANALHGTWRHQTV
jgi:hypothetical protein